MSLESTLFRLHCYISDGKRDQGLVTPKSIRRFDHLAYGDDKEQTLDIYRRKDAEGEDPVIVSVHGGGYVYGSTKQYQFYCMELAKAGFTVVNFNYRKAPEHKFPAPLEDLNLVMSWLGRHQKKYGADMQRVFLIGDSAGAQLASQYAVMCTNPEYAEIMEIEPPAFGLRGLSLACGMYDLRKSAMEDGLHKAMRADYFGRHPEDLGRKLDVLDYIDGNYPPVHIFTSRGDFLLPELEPMVKLLKERGVPCESKVYGDEKTFHVFHLNMRLPLADLANAEQIEFFRKCLGEEI